MSRSCPSLPPADETHRRFGSVIFTFPVNCPEMLANTIFIRMAYSLSAIAVQPLAPWHALGQDGGILQERIGAIRRDSTG